MTGSISVVIENEPNNVVDKVPREVCRDKTTLGNGREKFLSHYIFELRIFFSSTERQREYNFLCEEFYRSCYE